MNRALCLWAQAALLLLLAAPQEGDAQYFWSDDAGCGCCFPLAAPLVFVPPCPFGCDCEGLSPVEPQFAPMPTLVEPTAPPAQPPAEPPTPVVKLHVRVPALSTPGQPLEYQIRVENPSAADAHHVVVKNALPANAKLVRASPEPHVKEPEL